MKRRIYIIAIIMVSLVAVILSANAEQNNATFEIKDGIIFGDSRSDVKEKETQPFDKSSDDYLMFGSNKAFGIDLESAEYKFDTQDKMIHALYRVDKGDKDSIEKDYNTLDSLFTDKYGEPIDNSIIPEDIKIPAKSSAITNMRLQEQMQNRKTELVAEKNWIEPTFGIIINLVHFSVEDTHFLNFSFSYDPRFLSKEKQESANMKYDFKQFYWGDSRERVESIEGAPESVGEESGTGYISIAYSRNVAGLKAYLLYFFDNNRLCRIGYSLKEKHSNSLFYIDDYMTLKNALTKKYGNPIYDDDESWTPISKKSTYENNKGDALLYGYLSYYNKYLLDRCTIHLMTSADNYEVTTVLIYESTVIDSAEPDYSDEI